MQSVKLTNMCMIYDQDRILVLNRRNKNWGGITFPGGHIEPGEAIVDSVIREMKEETGLSISNPKLVGVKDWLEPDGSRYIAMLYKTNEFEGELVSSDEGEVFWTDIQEVFTLNMSQDFDKLLEIFLDDTKSEIRYRKENDKWICELI